MHVSRCGIDHERQTQRIDEQMPLASFDTLVSVKTTDAGGLLDGLHRLGIHDGRARMRLPPHAPTFSVPQPTPEMRPEASATKLSEVIVDRLPRRKITGQIAPGAARAQEIKQGIEDGAKRVAAEFPMG